MLCYALGLLPPIRQLKTEFPKVEQPLYADDAGAYAMFALKHCMFLCLKGLGPAYGYHTEPSKSILVVSRCNLQRANVDFPDLGFKVQIGSRYLGGFIVEDENQDH
jgi:hypothetical protein